MKNPFWLTWLLLASLAAASHQNLKAQCNRALDFDGTDDFVQVNSPYTGQSDFTLEVNFKSDNTFTSGCGSTDLTNFRWLFSWDDDHFGVGDCGGHLALIHAPSCPTSPFVCNVFSSPGINDGEWHCLGISQNLTEMTVYLDGTLIHTMSTPIKYDLAGSFRIGSGSSGSGTVGKKWLGQVDDFRLWGTPNGAAHFAASCDCPYPARQARLLLHFNFDLGTPEGENTSLAQVTDGSGNGNHGVLNNFSLGNPLLPPADKSNFVCNDDAGFMPYLAGMSLEIKDFLPLGPPISEICSGDAVHFCLKDDIGQSPPPSGNIGLQWEMNDGSGWANVASPDFLGYCFTVKKNQITAHCGAGSTGLANIRYRARFNVMGSSGMATCPMFSEEAMLKVCCPISAATVNVTTDVAGDLLCVGDAVNFTVSLSSPDDFVTTLGPETHISWKFNGVSIGHDDQTSFSYSVPMVAAPGACFEATISNCSKTATFSKCITVDKEPHCGSITSLSPASELMPDPLGDPNLFYICPGDDGVLGMVNPADFYDCKCAWQRSFTPSDPMSWMDMGSSNSVQNTNTLSSYYWSGQTEIFYRVICRPLSTPSGCDPKFSNILQVKLKSPPAAASVVGDNQVCKDDVPISLTLSGLGSGETVEWFCNGLNIGSGSSAPVSKQACYWAEISNGCPGQTVETPRHCLQVCEIEPVIECPKNLNGEICIGLGETITLKACSSKDNCSGLLTYAWATSNNGPGTPGGANGCELTHTPDNAGTTYTVTITNTATGCSKTAQTTVVPCDKN